MADLKVNAVIGIDPGASGGIAVYVPGANVKTMRMPKDLAALGDFFKYYRENYAPIVFLEKLSLRPDDVSAQGNRLGKLFRVQKMMANYEHLKALIEVSGIPYVLTHPLTWQTRLKLRERGEHIDKAERKRNYKYVASKWYPGVQVTLWNADALLLMHFGRYALVNEPKWVKANLPKGVKESIFING